METLYYIMARTVSNQLLVKELAVSAGDNLVITLPDSETELKASVEPAPPAGESLTFLGNSGTGGTQVFSPRSPQIIGLMYPSHNIPQ